MAEEVENEIPYVPFCIVLLSMVLLYVNNPSEIPILLSTRVLPLTILLWNDACSTVLFHVNSIAREKFWTSKFFTVT